MTRQVRALLLYAASPALTLCIGCEGEPPEQRQSGTLAVPLESVERAGEESGRQEDAKLKSAKGAPKAR